MLKNKKGQTAVEGVLLIFLFVTITIFVSKYFKQNKLVSKAISGPWNHLDGMIQHGAWAPADEKQNHPNHKSRHLTTEE